MSAGISDAPPHTNEIGLTENARTVLGKRYLRRGADGKPVETIHEMFWRVARHVAAAESQLGEEEARPENERLNAETFYDLLTDLRFLPNSPTFTGAGTPLGQLAACFVLPIDDDMGRTEAGIFQTLRDAALVQQTGGGNGFSFSRLRPRNSIVQSSMGGASGPVGFLGVFDRAFGEIAQGGTRRGANMAVLEVNHPDIKDFVRCKSVEGDISNFNISVGITDDFMEAVKQNAMFPLVDPNTKEVVESIDARALFREIAEKAHHNGEPGVLFLDAANRANPVPHLYKLESTNPCGEQWLGPYESCCLGSINLAVHLTAGPPGREAAPAIDWTLLEQTIKEATRFLDDVVTANAYVPAVPQLKAAAEKCRRLGLGIMGLADAMFACGVAYGSDEGQEFGAQVMEFVRYHTLAESARLSVERGAFPAIEGSIWDPSSADATKWRPPTPLAPHTRDLGRPQLFWATLAETVARDGVRNAAQNTVAPTGTISTIAGCEGYGCEPAFALAYTRNVIDGDKKIRLKYSSPALERSLRARGADADARDAVFKAISASGSAVSAEGRAALAAANAEECAEVFVTSGDITPEGHILQQAALQRFVDNSISKTINMPNSATVADVEAAYFLAWEQGCRGLTVYRTGSRDVVVLETAETQAGAAPAADPASLTARHRRLRPSRLAGSTQKVQTPLGPAYVTVNADADEPTQPFEVFLSASKAGSDTAAVTEAFGRLISHILRAESPVPRRERLEEVTRQLEGIGGARSTGLGPKKVRSLPDGIAQALAQFLLVDTPEAADSAAGSESAPHRPGDLCPECGQATYVFAEGCKKCLSCGLSEC